MPYLDSRDLQERIDELESDLNDQYNDYIDHNNLYHEDYIFNRWLDANDKDDDVIEYKELLEFKDDVSSSEWDDGITFIPDDEFTEYAIEMLKDYGDLPQDIPWCIVIDEDATADNIKKDYSSVDFQGDTYWYRD